MGRPHADKVDVQTVTREGLRALSVTLTGVWGLVMGATFVQKIKRIPSGSMTPESSVTRKDQKCDNTR